MGLGNVLQVDVTLDPTDYKQGALRILEEVNPTLPTTWKIPDVKFQVFTEGITNILFLVYTEEVGRSEGLVFRIYGARTELIIDRQAEMRNMQILHSIGCGAPLYAKFNNGICYGFVDGDCLDMDTVRDPEIGSLVAAEMVRMHFLDPEKLKSQGIEIDTEPFLFKKIRTWLDIMPENFDDTKRNEILKTQIKSRDDLRAELAYLEEHLLALNAPVVFSHNDLLLKNIVYNKAKGRTIFIDYEYGAFNFEYFDLGNHFDEWAGIDTVDYNLYPDRDTQLPWLRRYLEHKATQAGRPASEVTDHDVEVLYVQTNKFSLAAHFFWGVWALIQAKYSTIDFDYLEYSVIRFTEYFAKRDKFLSLKMPE